MLCILMVLSYLAIMRDMLGEIEGHDKVRLAVSLLVVLLLPFAAIYLIVWVIDHWGLNQYKSSNLTAFKSGGCVCSTRTTRQ